MWQTSGLVTGWTALCVLIVEHSFSKMAVQMSRGKEGTTRAAVLEMSGLNGAVSSG